MPRLHGSRLSTRLAAGGAAVACALAAGVLVHPSGADAAPFTGGNLVVYRVGDGALSLTNSAAPVFLDEYSPSGTKVQSVALPTTAVDGNHVLTATGQSRSEGLISRSPDGKFIALTGYDAPVGTTGPGGLSLTTSSPTTTPRTVGLVDANGTVDTSTSLNGASDPKVIRTATTSDGDRTWAAGGNGGIVTRALGATTGTAITSAASNLTGLSIQGGRLFAGGILTNRLGIVGSGLPTSSASTTAVTGLPDNLLTYGYGLIDATAQSYQGTGLDTLYLANASERGGTVDKYTFDGTTWQRAGYVDVPNAFGLVAVKNGSAASLAVTTPTKLYSLSDPNAAASTFTGVVQTTLATAAAKTEFRGVALAPSAAPAPSVFARRPIAGGTVSQGAAGVPVSALVTGPSAISSVTAQLTGGSVVNLTKGSGNVWGGTLPLAGVAPGAKTVTIVATDAAAQTTTITKNVTVAAIVPPTGTAGPGTRSWTVSPVHRSGTWSTFSTSLSPNKLGLISGVKGRKAYVYTYGRSVSLTFKKSNNSGVATVVVDGVTTLVNLYSASTTTGTLTRTFGTGAAAKHTVSVTVRGTKSSASHGYYVGLIKYVVGS